MSPSTSTPVVGTAPDREQLQRVQRRTLTVVVISQVFGGAGLAAGITVGALLAQDMLGSDGMAGLPTALFTLGSALAAFLVGWITQKGGRRIGLGLGFSAGGLGAIGVVAAAVTEHVPLLFASLFVYGAGTATNLQARYAGTDLALPTRRGTAVSIAMVSTTLGAVAGPNLVEPLGRLATTVGVPELAGPFLLAAVAYLAAGAVLFSLLRPDPYLLARAINAAADRTRTDAHTTPTASLVGTGALVGATVMVLTQVAMVAIMTMTPVHMRAHHHGLGAVGLVIGLHVGAMFLPSLVTGALVDRVGRIPMACAAGVTLLSAGILAASRPVTPSDCSSSPSSCSASAGTSASSPARHWSWTPPPRPTGPAHKAPSTSSSLSRAPAVVPCPASSCPPPATRRSRSQADSSHCSSSPCSYGHEAEVDLLRSWHPRSHPVRRVVERRRSSPQTPARR